MKSEHQTKNQKLIRRTTDARQAGRAMCTPASPDKDRTESKHFSENSGKLCSSNF